MKVLSNVSRGADSQGQDETTASANNPRLVVLDFDGTITKSDTLRQFFIWSFFHHPRYNPRLLFLPLDLVRFLIGHLDTTSFKERLLTACVGGLPVSIVEQWARKFASRVSASRCNLEVLSFIRQCQARKDRLIVVSASPDIYVPLVAANLQISETICTRTEVESGCYTGRLVGRNCKGMEKLRRLKEYLGVPDVCISISIGNDESDMPILRVAQQGIMVKRGDLSSLRTISFDHVNNTH